MAAAIQRLSNLGRDDTVQAVAAGLTVGEACMRHEGGYSADTRVRWPEFLPWIAALAGFFLLPEYLSLGARILVYILYALSLDLIVGYAGIITLGHSAYFGVGAYAAGILAAKAGITDPLAQLAAAGAAGALLGIGTGAIILRTRALTLLMLTLAITSVCLEIANKATALTGGADGLSGVVVAPVLGLFRFDLFGKTAYLTRVRENSPRTRASAAPLSWRLVLGYTRSPAIAAVAGGLITQTNQFVG